MRVRVYGNETDQGARSVARIFFWGPMNFVNPMQFHYRPTYVEYVSTLLYRPKTSGLYTYLLSASTIAFCSSLLQKKEIRLL